jgi:hypothetical protein
MASRQLPRLVLVCHLLLPLLFSTNASAHRLRKRTNAIVPTESLLIATPTPSTFPDGDQPKENPWVSLALKISLGILAGLFTLSIIFCAMKAARRGSNDTKQDDNVGRLAGGLSPRYEDVKVDLEAAISRCPDDILRRPGWMASGDGLCGQERQEDEADDAIVRTRPSMPSIAHISEERVRSWVMQLDDREREAPPTYEGRRVT